MRQTAFFNEISFIIKTMQLILISWFYRKWENLSYGPIKDFSVANVPAMTRHLGIMCND
jgi:hypothetical protein